MRAEKPEDLRPKDDADFAELSLAYRGAQIAEVFSGRLPSNKELRDITQELGVEIASSVFLKTAHLAKGHGTFAREVRSFELPMAGDASAELKTLASGFELLFIPSNLPQSKRAWGDHVEAWRTWARGLGFTTDDVPTDARASVAANARTIFEYIKKHPHPNRVIVTYGQGASELRYLLHRTWGDAARELARNHNVSRNELPGLKGWINICGSFGGSSASRILTSNRVRAFVSSLASRLSGRSPHVLKETSSDFSMWKSPLRLPKDFLAISIVGVPTLAQVPVPYRSFYRELASTLPSDGVVTVSEASVPGGIILPIAGMSHHAENLKLEPIFKRLLGVMAVKLSPDSRAEADSAIQSSSSSRDHQIGPITLR